MKINVLDAKVYNRISAGEVVERPASIVKELVENSIDAGGKHIRIEIRDGGVKNITVSDDGCGIEKDDLVTAFLPHATSKISSVDDLDNIQSLGFRGEALASIGSVCQVKLGSKTKDAEVGYALSVDGGQFGDIIEVAKENGTTISCSNLFFNTPVRAKFLRKPKAEEAEITHLVEKFMLSHPEIAFEYYVDDKMVYNTSSCSLKEIIYTIYGKEIYDNLIEVYYKEDDIKIEGFVTKPKVSKSNRTYQTLFVNGRTIENFLISNAVQSVYESFLMKGRFPVYVLSLTVDATSVDVNVHPSKKEVKFENPNRIYGLFRKAVQNALSSVDQIQSFLSGGLNEEVKPPVQESGLLKQELDKLRIEKPKEMTKDEILDIHKPQGKSFSIDLVETDVPLIPEENEIEISSNRGISADEYLEKLSNLSIKDEDKPLNPRFEFDQTGEKFSQEIMTKEDNFLSASVKDQMKILGTIFNTYIVVELENAVYFIDQHAGHERLLYDKLVEEVDNGKIVKQGLLIPYTFKVGASESLIIDNLLTQLDKLGFDIVKKGYGYTLYSLPLLLINLDLDAFTKEILSESGKWELKTSDFIHEKLCQSACKHAIKGGDSISKDDCAYLIEQVRKGVMLCPHGRPVTLVITKTEFEKMFKRIV